MASIGARIEPDRTGHRLQRGAAESDRQMRRLVAKTVTTAESEVVPRTPVGATQTLRAGYATDGPRGGRGRWRAALVNPTVYHDIREDGRRPGRMPPVDALIPWVGTVLGVPIEDRRSVAYVVARAIGRRGYTGAHMIERGWAVTRRRIRPDLRKAGLAIAREITR